MGSHLPGPENQRGPCTNVDPQRGRRTPSVHCRSARVHATSTHRQEIRGADMIAILFAAVGSLCNASAAVVQRLAHVSAPPEVSTGWRKALYLVRQPLWLLGLLFWSGPWGFRPTIGRRACQ